MAEYLDVMEQFHRMCAKGNCSTATGCPMYPACNISQCRRIAFEKPAEFENRVMDWAKAHPEPQYPTWAVWFRQEGIAPPEQKAFHGWLFNPIPADIAEKLGIQPEEE